MLKTPFLGAALPTVLHHSLESVHSKNIMGRFRGDSWIGCRRVRWQRGSRHVAYRWRAHMPQVPAQHLWPLPLPRLPAPEAPALRSEGERRGAAATAECCQNSDGLRSWTSQRGGSDTDPVPGGGTGHQQQGRIERRGGEVGAGASAESWDELGEGARWRSSP